MKMVAGVEVFWRIEYASITSDVAADPFKKDTYQDNDDRSNKRH